MRTALRRARRSGTALSRDQQGWVWQAASLLLDYPGDDLADRLRLVDRVVAALPPQVGQPLGAAVARLDGVSLVDLQADYVDTFDSRRRHNLFLTYFAHGDTRKRGMALLRFKQAYLESGAELGADGELAGGELPDHLCVVLEYAATVDPERGRQLLLDHRAGLELLRLGLAESGSRWAGAVEAVTATLPPLDGDEVDAIRRLAAEGPPAEEVGLTPYATPGFDPGPAAPGRSGPTPLPMPTVRGAR
ncbi:nitrate reductase molybdenum cofactor assembly chaperone [Nocardioides sp. SYSU DS0651]|uniref:nitrate reductase molybdenum cofactor assembly chaperone n=1 Tax=Nocardioides sp. SYSU DS0651 TaxID=3415955 RepID=UPI003F4CA20E